jgi:ubiquinone/menaquinone biosynthesis C-methylase UbiE
MHSLPLLLTSCINARLPRSSNKSTSPILKSLTDATDQNRPSSSVPGINKATSFSELNPQSLVMDDLNKGIAATYDRENRGVPRLFARHITALLPPITNTSVIHDNACGPAVVTSEILSRVSSDGMPVSIAATDISPAMIAASDDIIKTQNWNCVTATIMNSQTLSFENDTFSHSFTNFLVPSQPGAPSEIYRTLKSGGTAVMTEWKYHGFVDLMKRCTKVIIPNAEALGLLVNRWPTEEALKAQFEMAGFGKNNIQVQSHCEYLAFENLDDLFSLFNGPFGKFFTKDWKAEEVDQIPEVIKQVLTAEELERESLEMIAWIVIAKKI